MKEKFCCEEIQKSKINVKSIFTKPKNRFRFEDQKQEQDLEEIVCNIISKNKKIIIFK